MADTYVVERSQFMNASPEAVFAQIVDFHEWEQWSPWAALDPDMDTSYSGDPGTVGAGYAWSGNRKVGEGRMTTTQIEAPHHVAMDLEFLKPFKSKSVSEFTIAPDGDGTTVTWQMSGENTLITRVMGIFKSIDSMIGPDFETGLASLKSVVER